ASRAVSPLSLHDALPIYCATDPVCAGISAALLFLLIYCIEYQLIFRYNVGRKVGAYMVSFGVTIKELRLKKSLTQRELASKIGVDFTYISKLENHQLEPPSEEVIVKMAKVFAVDRHWLTLVAGKVPSDFAEVILKNKDVQEFIMKKMKELFL